MKAYDNDRLTMVKRYFLNEMSSRGITINDEITDPKFYEKYRKEYQHIRVKKVLEIWGYGNDYVILDERSYGLPRVLTLRGIRNIKKWIEDGCEVNKKYIKMFESLFNNKNYGVTKENLTKARDYLSSM